ncbi:MAG: hypothetical protein M3Z20_02615, partial [Chloroflexota bacterium]|nr:hypothetical protein [Chloroflexota bacterium]
MDPRRFDTLARAFAVGGTRRHLIAALAALPLVGALTDLVDEAEAEKPHDRLKQRKAAQRRKRRHRKHQNTRNTTNKGDNGGNGNGNGGNGGGGGGGGSRPGSCAANGTACTRDSDCCAHNC